jgi:hypothetical protein
MRSWRGRSAWDRPCRSGNLITRELSPSIQSTCPGSDLTVTGSDQTLTIDTILRMRIQAGVRMTPRPTSFEPARRRPSGASPPVPWCCPGPIPYRGDNEVGLGGQGFLSDCPTGPRPAGIAHEAEALTTVPRLFSPSADPLGRSWVVPSKWVVFGVGACGHVPGGPLAGPGPGQLRLGEAGARERHHEGGPSGRRRRVPGVLTETAAPPRPWLGVPLGQRWRPG